MQDTAKYLIHAQITANGVVERSDVVGAIFGQTEGLLGEELDLRELQDSAKLGRIDVEIDSERGRSFGEVTIASGLDRVETAILAAALETIERVGPCRATVEVTDLEDVRQAKRRAVVDRAKELLAAFDESVLSSEEIVEEVRRSARVERISEYEGYPAGPRVADSDAIVVVEGRADVLQLLEYGIKNAVAVEGTDVPEAVARLTKNRTVTAFLDGDRGGDLILKELSQIGDVDFVAFAPSGQSVEDLSRDDVMSALREKVPFEELVDAEHPHETVAATDGSVRAAPETTTVSTQSADAEPTPPESTDRANTPDASVDSTEGTPAVDEESIAEASEASTDTAESSEAQGERTTADAGESAEESDETTAAAEADGTESGSDRPLTLSDHVAEIIDEESGLVRLLDEGLNPIVDADADSAFDTIADADTVPRTVLLDGELDQRLLDVAAQRGVDRIVARSEGQFVKKPASVHIQTVA